MSQEAAQASMPMKDWPKSKVVELMPEETHFTHVTQLTFGGQNAEAYWSKNGKHIVYQTLQPTYPDEQIFTMDVDGGHKKLMSTGLGRCTCSYYSPDQKYVYFSSTHERNAGPQKKLDRSKGYVWMVNPDFIIYRRNLATNKLEKVFSTNGYVAETTIDPNGKYLTFTSDMQGDLEIYRADLHGKNVKRLTHHDGYDGGPFVSWDGKKIAYRRDIDGTPEQLKDYKDLLKDHMVRPTRLEIWMMNADGTGNKQITRLKKASFAPFLHPDGKRIIFCSNWEDPKGREFDLYMIRTDGSHLERITYSGGFDGFPMFTKDGKKLVFSSNRYHGAPNETNIFVADWKD
jgi:Tol biopolymer transport system component